MATGSAIAVAEPAWAGERPEDSATAETKASTPSSSQGAVVQGDEEPQILSVANEDSVPAEPQNRAVSPVLARRSGSLPNFLIAGFAEVGSSFSDSESTSGKTFISGSFNPGLYFQFQDLLLFESELEMTVDEDGNSDVLVEFAQLDLLLHNNVTLVAGKFLSPVGQYSERLHPAWINRMADAPAGFGHDGLQPGADVGAQLRGGVPVGKSRFSYAIAVGNGPQLSVHGSPMQEGFLDDDNDNKAVSGRIGFLPVPHLEFGASFLTAKVRPMPEEEEEPEEEMTSAAEAEAMAAGPNTRFKIWGLDAAYTRGPWDVRAEVLRGTRAGYEIAPAMDDEEPVVVPKLKLTAWYAQLAYRLSGITQHRILQNFEPVVRYGEYQVDGLEELAEEAEEKRWDLGLNYWFTPSLVVHSALQHRKFTAREEDRNDTRFLLQLGYGF